MPHRRAATALLPPFGSSRGPFGERSEPASAASPRAQRGPPPSSPPRRAQSTPARSAQRAHNVKSTTPGRRSTPGGTTWLRALLHPRAVLLQRGPSPRKFTLLHVRTSMVRKTSWPLPARTRPCESSDYSASKCANGHIILYRAAHYPGVLRLGWGAGAWRILWGEGGPKKICVCLRP